MATRRTPRDHETVVTLDDLDTVMLCAFRYALGRCSYIVSWMSEIVARHRAKLTSNTRHVIARDIVEALVRDAAGWDCDRREWLRLGRVLYAEMSNDEKRDVRRATAWLGEDAWKQLEDE